MEDFRPVARLRDVGAAVRVQPLESGDRRYVDLGRGRRTDDLKFLRICLQDHDADRNSFAKVALTGHRGCGKSTELLRLEQDLSGRFFPLHFYATEEEVLPDYDYADLFLWLTDELLRRFQGQGISLDPGLAEDVALWFAKITVGDVDSVKKEIDLAAEAEAKGKWGALGFSVGILARLKSRILGSHEARREIRRELQSYSTELIRRFNLLLDNAHQALRNASKPANLLMVVDNLDRLSPPVASNLFFDNGEMLKLPRAHVIYTVPIATVLAPRNVGTVFEHQFTLPMVKVRQRDGKPFAEGIRALTELLAARIDLDAIFGSKGVVRKLVEMSGGSVRDLMRLVDLAQLIARADEQELIDMDSAKRSIAKLRLYFEQLLVPAASYFPRLARIHQRKDDGSQVGEDSEEIQKDRDFLSQLLFNGSILEYNGGESWYDVHPIVQQIRAFREIVADGSGSE
jgi:hypothetical protein